MPTVSDWAPVRTDHIFAGITDNGRVVADVRAAAATMLETDDDFLKAVSAIYAMGTADLERLVTLTSFTAAQIASTTGTGVIPQAALAMFDDTAPTDTTENQYGALRMTATRVLLNVTADPTTPTDRQHVLAAAATQDETVAQYATVAAALYAFGGVDLDRLRAQGTDADNIAVLAAGAQVTAAYGYLFDSVGVNWDRALGVAGAAVVTGPMEDEDAWTFGTSRVFPIAFVADEAAPDSVAEDQVGIPRMTLTRVANFVATDPTTITQRQRVLAAAATQDETATQYATAAVALYGFDTIAAAASALTRLTTVRGPLADVNGGAILGLGMMATFDDAGPPTVTTENNVGTVRMTTRRVLMGVITDPATPTQQALVPAAGADGQANTDDSLLTSSWDMRFNDTTWDRTRNNHEVTALVGAARVATTQSAELTAYNARGVAIYLDVTAVGAPAGQINSLEVQVPIGANWDTIYQFPAINLAAVGRRFFLIYPGAASAGSWSQVPFQGVVPRRWRVQTTHNDANSISYSVTASYQE